MSDNEGIEVPTVEPDEITDLDVVTEALFGGELTVEVDPEAVAHEIVRRILAANSADAAMRELPVWHAKEVVGAALELRSVRWYPSTVANGPRVFAAVEAVDLNTGEIGVFTTSAYKQLAKLVVLTREKAFPRQVRNTTTSRPTAAGFYPLDFEDLPKDQG